jgi:hypothetical protein
VRRLKHAVGTLIGRPRRQWFLKTLPKDAVVAEIGVFRGHFSRHILKLARPRELHLIDGWWALYGDRFPDWGEYTDFGNLSTHAAYEEAVAIVEKARGSTACEFHVGDDRTVLPQFPDGYFDWVYLDSSHDYEPTLEELEILRTKVKLGGLITGDDYHPDPSHHHHELYQAVHSFCDRHGWEVKASDRFGQWSIAEVATPQSVDAQRPQRAMRSG